MARKKSPNQADLLTKLIGVRLSVEVYDKLEKQRQSTNCQTVAELARRILSKEKIIFYHKDASMDAHLELLAGIEKELNAIGVNINQITRYFNQTENASQKTFKALKVADEYKKVGSQVDQLMKIVSELSKKWLQK